jgi:hypothetical protein
MKSADFDEVSLRLEYLESWREIAIRPNPDECHEEDMEFLEKEIDDLDDLSQRCLKVRNEMNSILPMHDLTKIDDDLVVKKSAIVNAGDGLYYEPSCSGPSIIAKGSTICYYSGHRHNFNSQKFLKDRSYLLNVEGDVLVDPCPLFHIKARYINDPLNETAINCEFVPEVSKFRCVVVAKRHIYPGEELYLSYGPIYWSQQEIRGTVHRVDKTL